jgi:hypothetical protein
VSSVGGWALGVGLFVLLLRWLVRQKLHFNCCSLYIYRAGRGFAASGRIDTHRSGDSDLGQPRRHSRKVVPPDSITHDEAQYLLQINLYLSVDSVVYPQRMTEIAVEEGNVEKRSPLETVTEF